MRLEGVCAFVTGGARGLGAALVRELAARGARRIYASSRDVSSLDGVLRDVGQAVPIALDVTSPQSVAAAAAACGEVGLLINNAGYVRHARFLAMPDLEGARLEMETNYWGVLNCCRAFAPGLAAGGGGGIVNVLSISALASMPEVGPYSASKAAALSLTQGVRAELAQQGTLVTAVIAGPILTDMARAATGRHPPGDVAARILDAVERGETLVFPDPTSAAIGQAYASAPWALEARVSRLAGTTATAPTRAGGGKDEGR